MASTMSLADATERVKASEDSCSDWEMLEDDSVRSVTVHVIIQASKQEPRLLQVNHYILVIHVNRAC